MFFKQKLRKNTDCIHLNDFIQLISNSKEIHKTKDNQPTDGKYGTTRSTKYHHTTASRLVQF